MMRSSEPAGEISGVADSMQNASMIDSNAGRTVNANATAEPRRTGRRRDRERRENEILRAAFEEFAARGYAATRLEDVARRAGVAKGLPNFYFESKVGLFKAVLRRLVLPDWGALEAQLDNTEATAPVLLRGLLTTVYQRFVSDPQVRQLIRLLIAEGPKFPELTEFYHAEVIEHAVALLGKALTRGVERGEIRPGLFRAYPQVIVAPALMAILWQLLFADRHPLDLARFFDAHLDLVLNGLTTR
jgi:AcrR family transcriptional regulator